MVDVVEVGAQPCLGIAGVRQAGGAQQDVVCEVLRNQRFKGFVDRTKAFADGTDDGFAPLRQPRNRRGLVDDKVGERRLGAEVRQAFLAIDRRGFIADVVRVDEARMPDVACAEKRPPEQRKERVGFQLGTRAEETAPFVAAAFRHPGQGRTGQVNGM
ncbi:hypothetical protein D9M68_678670 [compost metagenome]